jgi:hypothetical protein
VIVYSDSDQEEYRFDDSELGSVVCAAEEPVPVPHLEHPVKCGFYSIFCRLNKHFTECPC